MWMPRIYLLSSDLWNHAARTQVMRLFSVKRLRCLKMSANSMPQEEVRELNPQEMAALSAAMTELLKKHNAELSVVSSIRLMRYVKDDGYNDTGKAGEPTEASSPNEEAKGLGEGVSSNG